MEHYFLSILASAEMLIPDCFLIISPCRLARQYFYPHFKAFSDLTLSWLLPCPSWKNFGSSYCMKHLPGQWMQPSLLHSFHSIFHAGELSVFATSSRFTQKQKKSNISQKLLSCTCLGFKGLNHDELATQCHKINLQEFLMLQWLAFTTSD